MTTYSVNRQSPNNYYNSPVKMTSTLASTPTVNSATMEMDKEWITTVNRRQAELLHHQLMDQYINLMKLDAPLSFNSRSERDWDNFFAKLEERFQIVGVLPEYKIHLTRRYLRDDYLRKWVELSGQSDATYESVRDGLYRAFFPNSDMWESVMKIVIGPWTDAPNPIAVIAATDAIPIDANPSGEAQQTSSNPDDTQNQHQSPQATRRAFTSATSIRNRVNSERRNLNRVAARYGKTTPQEDVWVKWAISMMAPALHETVKILDPQCLSNVVNMLDTLVETENSLNNRFRSRKNRNRFKKPNARRLSASTNGNKGNTEQKNKPTDPATATTAPNYRNTSNVATQS